jgi:hypothetical protein
MVIIFLDEAVKNLYTGYLIWVASTGRGRLVWV